METKLEKKMFNNTIIVIYNLENGVHGSYLARHLDMTWAYTYKILKWLRCAGLIVTELKGRKKVIYLTNKGKRIQTHISKIYHEMEGLKCF